MRVIGKIAVVLAVVVAVGLLTMQVAFVASSWVAARTGHDVLVVTGGSMEPHYDLGDAVLMDRAAGDDPQVGQVVTYRDRTGNLTTHRVVAVVDVKGTPHLQTQGDANAEPDPDLTPADAVVGVPGRRLPKAGFLVDFLNSAQGRAVTLAPAFLLVALAELKTAVAVWREDAAAATGGT